MQEAKKIWLCRLWPWAIVDTTESPRVCRRWPSIDFHSTWWDWIRYTKTHKLERLYTVYILSCTKVLLNTGMMFVVISSKLFDAPYDTRIYHIILVCKFILYRYVIIIIFGHGFIFRTVYYIHTDLYKPILWFGRVNDVSANHNEFQALCA